MFDQELSEQSGSNSSNSDYSRSIRFLSSLARRYEKKYRHVRSLLKKSEDIIDQLNRQLMNREQAPTPQQDWPPSSKLTDPMIWDVLSQEGLKQEADSMNIECPEPSGLSNLPLSNLPSSQKDTQADSSLCQSVRSSLEKQNKELRLQLSRKISELNQVKADLQTLQTRFDTLEDISKTSLTKSFGNPTSQGVGLRTFSELCKQYSEEADLQRFMLEEQQKKTVFESAKEGQQVQSKDTFSKRLLEKQYYPSREVDLVPEPLSNIPAPRGQLASLHGLLGKDLFVDNCAVLFDEGEYSGQTLAGRAWGTGIFHWKNGDTYQGEFWDNRPHGEGELTFSNGVRILGQFENGLASGWGKIRYPCINLFTGGMALCGERSRGEGPESQEVEELSGPPENCSEAKIEGASEIDPNVEAANFQPQLQEKDWLHLYEEYEGQFKEGQKHGWGKLLFKDGTVYEGEFKQGYMEGFGRLFYRLGGSSLNRQSLQEQEVYYGEFARNTKQGRGMLLTKEAILVGEFVEDEMHGFMEKYTHSSSVGYNNGKHLFSMRVSDESIRQSFSASVQQSFCKTPKGNK